MKMPLALKLSSVAILSGGLLFGASSDDKVVSFLKKSIASNKGYTVKSVNVTNKVDLKQAPNWKAYFIKIELHVNKDNKDVNVTDMIFSNGEVMARDLMDLNTKRNLKNDISIPLSPKLYDKEHLIAGHTNAKNKLVVFSDPVCPFCIDYVPDVIKAVQKYPDTFALYYYHLPLPMHKSAAGFTKAMIVAEKEGVKDVSLKTYESDFSSRIPTDEEIAKTFNKAFGTKITPKQMNEKWVVAKMEKDIEIAQSLMVNGTPTVYVNGEKDTTRKLFKDLLSKAKK